MGVRGGGGGGDQGKNPAMVLLLYTVKSCIHTNHTQMLSKLKFFKTGHNPLFCEEVRSFI